MEHDDQLKKFQEENMQIKQKIDQLPKIIVERKSSFEEIKVKQEIELKQRNEAIQLR